MNFNWNQILQFAIAFALGAILAGVIKNALKSNPTFGKYLGFEE